VTPNQPLIQWAPDADPTQPGIIVDAEQMIPTQRGYAPDFVLMASTSYPHTLAAAPTGAARVFTNSSIYGSTALIGTATSIYAVTPAALVDITRATPGYATVNNRALNGWRFDAFDDVVLAVSLNNVLQETAGAESGVLFTDVAGAPSANCIAVQSQFVMLANFPSTGSFPYSDGYWCSAVADHTDWVLDPATFCEQDRLLETPGPILRLIAYQNEILAFKPTSILRGRFSGQPSKPWVWSVVTDTVGIVGHDAICEADDGVLYWLARDGFYSFNGGAVQRIRTAPWEWFQNQIPTQANLYTTSCGWDSVRRCVRWLYTRNFLSEVSTESIYGGIAYHPDTGRWGPFETVAQAFVTLPYDDVPSVRSNAVVRRLNVPAVINAFNRQIETWRGQSATSSLTTGDVGDDDANFVITKARMRNMVHGRTAATISAQHFYRQNLDESLATGDTVFKSDGKFDFSQSARWHRLKFACIGMLEIFGFRVKVPKTGDR
jgi:hypothetical protein